MSKAGVDANQLIYTALINGYFKTERAEKVIHLLKDIEFDLSLYGTVVWGLCDQGKLEEAKVVISEILERDVKANHIIFTTLVDAYFKAGKEPEALKVIEEMQNLDLVPTVVTFCILIDGLCKAGLVREAMDHFRSMANMSLQPNVLAYTALVDGLCKNNFLEEAEKLFDEMLEKGIVPDKVAYTALVDGLCKNNCLEEAGKLFDKQFFKISEYALLNHCLVLLFHNVLAAVIMDLVMLYNEEHYSGVGSKLSFRRTGRFHIVQQIGVNGYKLDLPRHIRRSPFVNVSLLSPFVGDHVPPITLPILVPHQYDLDRIDTVLEKSTNETTKRGVYHMYKLHWLGKPNSEDSWISEANETRIKIGVGVRMRWQRRNEKIVLQETCCLEWQNLIAEACRRGSKGEIELQWNSYMILDKQMEREWSESIEEMNSTLKLKANRSAPKSPEQRKKISEAISAKWADPVYRERVQSAQLKYHGTPVGAKRRLRRKPSGDAQSLSRNPLKKNAASSGYENESKSQRWFRLKKNSEASYKDPLIDSKLQMIKNIRTQRSSIETNRTKAVQRAKLMISQAEKAVEVLEMVAAKNPRVQASLVESKKFLAKANDSMKSIKTGQTSSRRAKSYGYSSIGRGNGYEETVSANGVIQPNEEVNGTHVPVLNNNWSTKKTVSAEGNLIQPNEEVTGTHVTFLINKGSTESFGLRDLLTSGELLESYTQRDSKDEQMVPNEQEKADKCQRTVIKTEEKTKVPKAEKLVISDANTAINWKWVRGRRVEMSEDN
ncbi:hypothetical protein GIB67_041233 [Kingdonia uniflora]|uniref:Tf2-1-like SH3-like domain-containing protein n=1 Tax=Kingdonia uniflora TaxID=39325 RepID=A0A7J7MGH8_9MAGN|nr:hypothetical protein GIB67_041233 [Kingdonia uniflora]